MIFFVIWAFTAYGMTNILVYGSIFEGSRNFIKRNSSFLGDLVSCVMCTSTWVGFFMSYITDGFVINFFNIQPFWGLFLDGMLTSGVVWCINSIVEYYESFE